MNAPKNKKGLGKGLSALIPAMSNEQEQSTAEQVKLLAPELLFANPDQPRKIFDEEKLAELAESLKEHGMVQPLIVMPQKNKYMIIAGERRFRAAALAGMTEIPCMVREFEPQEIMEIALIENIQRENLNAWEEAESLRSLQDEFGYTQEQMAQKLGKSRPYIANTMRLLALDDYCAELLKNNQLSAGHARALLAVDGEYNRKALAGRIIREKLSVRETEQLVKNAGKLAMKPKKKKKFKKPAEYAAIEKQLRYKFGSKVSLQKAEKGGQIVIDYYSEEDLTRLIDILLPDVEF